MDGEEKLERVLFGRRITALEKLPFRQDELLHRAAEEIACLTIENARLTGEVERLASNAQDDHERFVALQGELLGTQEACAALRIERNVAQKSLERQEAERRVVEAAKVCKAYSDEIKRGGASFILTSCGIEMDAAVDSLAALEKQP